MAGGVTGDEVEVLRVFLEGLREALGLVDGGVGVEFGEIHGSDLEDIVFDGPGALDLILRAGDVEGEGLLELAVDAEVGGEIAVELGEDCAVVVGEDEGLGAKAVLGRVVFGRGYAFGGARSLGSATVVAADVGAGARLLRFGGRLQFGGGGLHFEILLFHDCSSLPIWNGALMPGLRIAGCRQISGVGWRGSWSARC